MKWDTSAVAFKWIIFISILFKHRKKKGNVMNKRVMNQKETDKEFIWKFKMHFIDSINYSKKHA